MVLACAGDVPTLETLAAAALLREHLPDLRGARRQRRRPDAPAARAPSIRTGCPTREFDALFTDRPAGDLRLPRLPVADPPPHLPARRTTHNLHVRGYKEEGTTTTPFDMVMLNDLDRFHLVMDVIDRVPGPRASAPPACARRWSTSACARRAYTREHGEDPPEVRDWRLAGA